MQNWINDLHPEQVEEILALMPLAITVIEMPSQKYIMANANYCKVLRTRLEPHQLVGKHVSEIISEPNAEALASLNNAHVRGESTRFGTLVSTSVGAEKSYWTGAAIPILRDEQKTWVLALLADITNQVLAKKEAENKSHELEMEKQRTAEFVAMAVHELRTPITSLKMLTQFLQSKQASSENSKLLKKIDQQSTRLVRLIDDLLNSVRSSAGQLDTRVEPLEISELMEDFYSEVAMLGKKAKVEILGEAESARLVIRADRDRLRQVLLNLIHNALVHAESDEPIQLRFTSSDQFVRFEVIDRGKGIPPESIEKIFDRFYRGPAKRPASGLGLGLYLSRMLIESMGGEIWAESEGINQGSKFIVKFSREANRCV